MDNWAQLLPELGFLLKPECNPPVDSPETLKQGFMRQDLSTKEAVGVHRSRRITGFIIYSWPVQAVVFLVILLDVSVFLMTLRTDMSEEWLRPVEWLIIAVLAIDVLSRLYFEGCQFFRSCLNCLEAILVVLAVAEGLALEASSPLPVLRWLRPIFRGLRLVRVAVRGLAKTSGYLTHLRHTISENRIRYMQDGFDLDLAYIGTQIIVMSMPAVMPLAWICNPHQEVARLLNEKHFGKYLLVNLTEEQVYPTAGFFGRVFNFPIQKDGAPCLEAFVRLCKVLDTFLSVDTDHVVALHSKFGQGRVSLVSLGLQIYRSREAPASAIAKFERARLDPDKGMVTQTFDSASQRRFLEYFAHVCSMNETSEKIVIPVRKARLTRIRVMGLPQVGTIDVSAFKHHGPRCRSDGQLRTDIGVAPGRSGSKLAQISPPGSPKRVGQGADGPSWRETDNLAGAHTTSTRSLASLYRKTKSESIDEFFLMDTGSHWQSWMGEQTADSYLSGCLPHPGDAIVSSSPEAVNGGITPQVADGDLMQPGVWTIDKQEFRKEFRIEVHRRKKVLDVKRVSRCRRILRRLLCLECFCRKRRGNSASDGTWQGGMLFSCTFHTAFLEYDEPGYLAESNTKSKLVVARLDRTRIDKAGKSPSLRSYNSQFHIEFTFEVDRRREWSLDDQVEFASPILSSGADRSETFDMGWLTWVAEKIWPSFRKGLEAMIQDSIIPSLKDSLPGPLKNIKLTECSFGEEHPQFDQIVAGSRHLDGLEVQLDFGLNYTTKTNIVLEVGIASFGITYLKLQGMLSIKFRPIVQELPVLVSMQLLFVNAPVIDLSFSNSLEIANFSLVKSMIFDQINKQVSDLLVLPNIMVINWGDASNANALSFMSVMPCSVVQIGVLRGREIKADTTIFTRLPDSCCRISLCQQQEQTSQVQKSKDPEWGEFFEFVLYDERQFVTFTVWDMDFTGRLKQMGETEPIAVHDIAGAGPGGLWVTLKTATTTAAKPSGSTAPATAGSRRSRRQTSPSSGAAGHVDFEDSNSFRSRSPRTSKSTSGKAGQDAAGSPCADPSANGSPALGSGAAAGAGAVAGAAGAGAQESQILVSALFKDLVPDSHKIKELRHTTLDPRSDFIDDDLDQKEEESRISSDEGGDMRIPIMASPRGGGMTCCCTGDESPTSDHQADSTIWCGSNPLVSVAKLQKVAMLVVEIHGGYLPPELGQADCLEIEVKHGLGTGLQQAQVSTKDAGHLSEKTQQQILNLKSYGMVAGQIAEALEEEVATVQRVMRQNEWNFEMRQKIPVLLTEHDLDEPSVQIAAIVKGKVVAKAPFDVRKILKPRHAKFTDTIQLVAVKGGESAKLEVEFRLFAIEDRAKAQVAGGGAVQEDYVNPAAAWDGAAEEHAAGDTSWGLHVAVV